MLSDLGLRAWSGATSTEILRGLSLQIEAGERVRICGDRASGKTTLLRVIAGIAPASSGTCQLTVRALPLLGNGSTYDATLSIEDNIRLHLLGWKEAPESSFAAFSESVLAAAGVVAPNGLRPEQLKADQQIRILAAAALLLRPQLLLIDEIDEKLDPAFAAWAAPLISTSLPEDAILVAVGSWTMSCPPALFTREITLADGHVAEDCELASRRPGT